MFNSKPPVRIITERLVLRCWYEADLELAREAIGSSLEHLRPWMPWALDEPKYRRREDKKTSSGALRDTLGFEMTPELWQAPENRAGSD